MQYIIVLKFLHGIKAQNIAILKQELSLLVETIRICCKNFLVRQLSKHRNGFQWLAARVCTRGQLELHFLEV